MPHGCTIGGREVSLEWTVRSARAVRFRAGKIGEDPAELWQGLGDQKRADYAAGCLLWLLAPDDLHAAHKTPDSLWMQVTDDEVPDVLRAIVATLGDSSTDTEKKSTSPTSHSPGSNSD